MKRYDCPTFLLSQSSNTHYNHNIQRQNGPLYEILRRNQKVDNASCVAEYSKIVQFRSGEWAPATPLVLLIISQATSHNTQYRLPDKYNSHSQYTKRSLLLTILKQACRVRAATTTKCCGQQQILSRMRLARPCAVTLPTVAIYVAEHMQTTSAADL